MTIGVICAMEQEIDLIRKDIKAEKVVTVASREFHIGKLYGKDVVLVVGRIGKVAVSVTTSLLIDRFNVDKIVFCGAAGGVDPSLKVGDAVVGDLSVQHDFSLPWGEPFRIPGIEVSYIESDKEMTMLAKKAIQFYMNNEMMQDIPRYYLKKFGISSPKVCVGTIASGDEFVCTKEKNKWLLENVRNIKCVEMEGAAVAQVCYEYKIPFTILRIISDCANDDAQVDFDLFIDEAAKHFTKGSLKAFFGLL